MAKYEAYPAYKDSGVEWFNKVPEYWDVVPLKYMTQGFVKDGPHETPSFVDSGVPFLSVDGIQNGKLMFEGCRYITRQDHERYSLKCQPKQGDVLLGKAASVGKVAYVDVNIEFNVWSPLAVIRAKNKSFGRYIYYCLQSSELQAQCDIFSNSNTQKNLGMNTIDNLRFPCASKLEAKKIVNFLDYETDKIDELIEKKRKLIQLIKEKRQAVISHAVTKGLDPSVEMKDSGVGWLGKIPPHWDSKPLKHLCTLNDEVLSENTFKNMVIQYIEIGGVSATNGIIYIEEMLFENAPSRARRVVRDGDVIVSTVRTYLEAITYINNPPDNLVVSTGFAVIRPNNKLFKRYAHYCLRAKGFIKEVVSRSVGVSYPAINSSELVNIKIPSLDFNEQIQIADYLDQETAKIDHLISKAESAITLMQERRTALISAAVTGKIDVRDWQAPHTTNQLEGSA